MLGQEKIKKRTKRERRKKDKEGERESDRDRERQRERQRQRQTETERCGALSLKMQHILFFRDQSYWIMAKYVASADFILLYIFSQTHTG